ncbi:MAG: GDP-mannose 4,6-dehydratase [Chloroflexi bacterium]|nr:MAG: GDP-mannose 4,6-dehydratase [Chloroflexota bacterium]
MTKVVVTGGAGFIGSHLALKLAERGNHVTIVDDLSTGRVENIAALLKTSGAELVRGSVTDLSLLQSVFSGASYVFHLAAIPSVPRSIEDPLGTHQVNVTGTLNVLMAARDSNVKKVVYASSSSVYGDTPTLPKREDMVPSPQSPYAVAKLAGEYYCSVFHQVFGLPTVCLRYFNVYGPRQDPHSPYAAVIPKFITSVLQGKPPIIFGDGGQTRDFTYVEDATEANILAVESDATGIFNIGSGDRVSINELARLVLEILGKDLEPQHLEPRAGDIRHSLADIALAKTFGYTPRHSLSEGVRRTIDQGTWA